MLTIDPPPCSRITGIACLHPSIGPRRLTAMTRSHVSTSMSATARSFANCAGSVSAALLWRTSRRPNSRTAIATIAATWSSSLTSASMASARPPSSVMARATRSASAPRMSSTRTDAPSAAKSCAVASPMPDPPPVTIATLPSTRPIARTLANHLRVDAYSARSATAGRVRVAIHAGMVAIRLATTQRDRDGQEQRDPRDLRLGHRAEIGGEHAPREPPDRARRAAGRSATPTTRASSSPTSA